jgi:serine/threonine protein kinase
MPTETPKADFGPSTQQLDGVQNLDALTPGTALGGHKIVEMLAFDEFGIVYLAVDQALQKQVAIKEYFPAALARRRADLRVSLRSATCASAFTDGLNTFLREGELLSRLDHPALVHVTRSWEANDTAYLMMPYYDGMSLAAELKAMGHPPDEAWLRALLFGVLGALQTLHSVSWQHLGISPETIFLRKDGRPLLLGLGGVRRAVENNKKRPAAPLKPQPGPMDYAPLELQSGRVEPGQIGPWTDLYSLAAVVHQAIIGRPPLPAMLRAAGDRMPPLSVTVQTLSAAYPGLRYSTEFLGALDSALAVNPPQRPQSVAAFQLSLEPRVTSLGDQAASGPASAAYSSLFSAAPASERSEPSFKSNPSPTPPFRPPGADLKSASSGWRWVAALVFVTAVGTGAWLWASHADDETAAQATVAPAISPVESVAPAASEPAALGTEASASAPVPAPFSEPASAVASVTPPPVAPAASAPAVAPVPSSVVAQARTPAAAASSAPLAAATKPAPPAAAPKPAPASKSVAAATPATTSAASSAEDDDDEGRLTSTKALVSTPAKPAPAKTAAARHTPAPPDNPSAMCSGRTNFSLVYCMQTQCKLPKFSRHAQCEALRRQDELK